MTEVPLLYEVGGETRFDKVVVITAPRAAARAAPARARGTTATSGCSPTREKVKRADFVYVNTGSLEDLDAWVGGVMAKLVDGVTRRLLAAHSSLVVAVGRRRRLGRPRPSRGWYERLRYPLRYEQIVRGHARNYRLDPPLLAAVIYQESKFDAGRALELRGDRADAAPPGDRAGHRRCAPAARRSSLEDLYEPEINVRYGAWYLRHLLDKYGDEATALAAYNAGQANVDRWRREGRGIRFAETRHYVKRVQELKVIYARAYAE